MCTPEYLHSLNFNGIQPHNLQLRVGCPIMSLRNIDQSIGLCNGTRLIVKALQERIEDAEIITELVLVREFSFQELFFLSQKLGWTLS